MSKTATVEDFKAFWDVLQEPMGTMLHQASVVMAQRMSERQVEWSDLSDDEVLDLFRPAFLQVAPTAYPPLPPEEVEADVH